MMNTEHATTEQLVDYLHGELDPDRDAALLQHLEACPQCRAAYESEAGLTAALRRYAAMSERELPSGVAARIWDAVDAPPAPSPFAFWMRPVATIPAAAVLVLAILFGVSHVALQRPAIDAAYYIDDHAALLGTVPFSETSVVPASLANDETGADQQWLSSTSAGDSDANATR
jgi:anti-sigma factor RsiW